MVDNTTNTTPGTTPTPAKAKRKPAGIISQQILDDIALATKCHREATKSGIASALADGDWTLAEQTALGESVLKCNGLTDRIAPAKTFKKKRTKEEEAARASLLQALAVFQKGAKRNYPEPGAPERADFAVGLETDPSNESTSELMRICRAVLKLFPPTGTAVLKGVKAQHITALGDLIEQYENADFAQADAAGNTADLIKQLETEVKTKLNPARRDLQLAVDQIWFKGMQPNPEAIRRAFGLE